MASSVPRKDYYGHKLGLCLFSLIVQTYICKDPKIDNATQEPMNCTNHTAYVACLPAPNITCKDFNGSETQFTGKEIGFYQPIECRSVNGYSYKVAVALSLFLGWLGADRFYLGYPALGLLKFCTVGFCGIGSLIDFILISMQPVNFSHGLTPVVIGLKLKRSSLTLFECEKMPMYEMMEERRLQRTEKFHQPYCHQLFVHKGKLVGCIIIHSADHTKGVRAFAPTETLLKRRQ
ncbi:TM2 domain-containing protein 1, partial [Ophiophagus hannah]